MCLNDFLATLPKSNENSWAKCAENWFLCINYESKIESDEIAPRHYNRATLKSSCNSHWQCSDPKQLLNRFKIKMKTEKFTIHFAIFIVNIRINIRHFSYFSILFFFFSWKFATFLYSCINRVDIIAAQTYVGYISNFLIVVFFTMGISYEAVSSGLFVMKCEGRALPLMRAKKILLNVANMGRQSPENVAHGSDKINK